MDATPDAVADDGATHLLRDDNAEARPMRFADDPVQHSVRRAGAPATAHGHPEIVTTHDSVCSREHRRT